MKAKEHGISSVNDMTNNTQQSVKYAELLKHSDIASTIFQLRQKTIPDIVYHIITEGQPIAERPRKLAGEKLEVAKTEINSMLDMEILRRSRSRWANPLLLKKKKTGDCKPCGDYRKLNSIADVSATEDLIPKLNGKKVFTTLDLVKAYHQIPMADEDIQKTEIIIPFGLFEFVVMPFGLRCATQTFQRYIDSIFCDLDYVFCYIDDSNVRITRITCPTSTDNKCCNRLRQHGLSINPSK